MADTEQKTAWTVGRLLDWTTAHFQQKSVEVVQDILIGSPVDW
jgi:hypothetical protein